MRVSLNPVHLMMPVSFSSQLKNSSISKGKLVTLLYLSSSPFSLCVHVSLRMQEKAFVNQKSVSSQLRLSLNPWSSCLCVPNFGIKCTHRHAWIHVILGIYPGFHAFEVSMLKQSYFLKSNCLRQCYYCCDETP